MLMLASNVILERIKIDTGVDFGGPYKPRTSRSTKWMNNAPAIPALIYSMHRMLVVWIIVAHFHLCSLLGTLSGYTMLEVWAVAQPMRVCCGSRWGRCMLFINILESWWPVTWCIIWPRIQYTAGAASMAVHGSYTGQCGRGRPVRGDGPDFGTF